MKGMSDLLRQAQIMQSKMAKLQEEVGQRTVEAGSGGGMVRAVCTGNQEIKSITIDKSVVNPEDVEMLEDLVITAVNEALRLSRDLMEKEMGAITGGLKLPGMF